MTGRQRRKYDSEDLHQPCSLTMTFVITCRFISLHKKRFHARRDSSSHAQGERQAG